VQEGALIQLEPLGPRSLPQFADLLGGDGFGGCFCAVWTAFADDWSQRCGDPARPNLQETTRRVLAGEHVGYLVTEGDHLVAWTGSGPKTSFPLLATKLGSRLSPMADAVWSVGCVAIGPRHRGCGLSMRVVQAVIEQAKRAGAEAVEAYPTLPWDEPRSYRGAHTTFEKLGFQTVGRDQDGAAEILLMRLDLV
jgi:GNAT superfamily N-acetyltransferase